MTKLQHLHSIAACAAITASLLATAAPAATAATLTFDDLGLAPSQFLQIGLSPVAVGQGFTMSRSSVDLGTDGLLVNAVGSGNANNSGGNGSFSFLFAKNPGQALTAFLSRADGQAFSLQSLQYHGWNNNAAPSLTVTGVLATGGTLTQTFAITNTQSSPYQLASFSSAWTGLSSLSFTSPLASVGVFQFDNLVYALSPVPELPASATLAAGLAVLLLARRRGMQAERA